MKKILLCFSLFIFHFSLCSAQDTIFLRSGDIILSHVYKVGKQVSYTYFVSDTSLRYDSTRKSSINKSEVGYIHYANGKIQKFKAEKAPDSAKLRLTRRDSANMMLPQDTLLLWSGERVVSNIIKVGPRIYLQNFHDVTDKRYNLRRAEVHSIQYSDGRVKTWRARDSVTRKLFISANGGMSMPIADSRSYYTYGKNAPLPNNFSTINQNDGTGSHFDLNLGYKFYKVFDVAILAGEDMNPSLINGHQNYNVQQYLAGFGISSNGANHYISVRLEWLAGLTMVNFPSFSTGTESFNDNFMYASSTTNVNLTNGKGLENYFNFMVSYNPTPVFSIDLNAGILFAKIRYTNASTYTENFYSSGIPSSYVSSTTTQTNTNPITMSMAALQINLGVSYHFVKKK